MLYDDLKAAGCELDHHESDLYVKATPQAMAILDEYRRQRTRELGFKCQAFTMFRSLVDGELWCDVPFAWAPFWQKVEERAERIRQGAPARERARQDEIVTRAAPRWAWDLIDETLCCDMESSAFDGELRKRIAEAYEAMIVQTQRRKAG